MSQYEGCWCWSLQLRIWEQSPDMQGPVTVATLGTDPCLTPSPVPHLDTGHQTCTTQAILLIVIHSLIPNLHWPTGSTLYLLYIYEVICRMLCCAGRLTTQISRISSLDNYTSQTPDLCSVSWPGSVAGRQKHEPRQTRQHAAAAKWRAWAGATTPLHLDPAPAPAASRGNISQLWLINNIGVQLHLDI